MMQPADLIITNAHVVTVDADNPTAEAVAVRGNTIVFVGEAQAVTSFIGPQTQLIDAQKGTVLPGFIDAHFHLMQGAISLGDIPLYEVRSLAELATAVTTYAAQHPELPWLRGVGLRYDIPSASVPLTRQHLDAIEAERPLLLIAFDVHTAWANTAALTQAGLLSGLPDLAGGAEVVRGSDGLASGEVRETAAMRPLLDLIPEPDAVRRRQLVKEALAYLASLGVTSVHNMDGDRQQTAFYAALADVGELTCRVYMPYSITPDTPSAAIEQEAVPLRDDFQSELVYGGSVKFFMDGVFESYTAVSLKAYPDQPENFGKPIFDRDHFAAMAVAADRLGFQICVHACGDGAVRRVLDGLERVQQINGRRDSRHRIEHIELIDPADVPRFRQLGVIASMQPLHAPPPENVPDIWLDRVCPEQWSHAFAWETLREAGATLAFGSDWPVALPDPLLGIAAAVNRRPWQPGDVAQQQTVAAAIAAYTRDAAYAEFQEAVKGQIKVGLWADLVVLTADIFAVPPAEIGDMQVALTICNGRVVYKKGNDDDLE